jgi:bifunctional DNA-binding transcriptional regulator/antitoxin component of YhaV-PrlF toxin-antitoxin module
MTTSTLSQNGQTTIPAKVRQFLHLEPSHKIFYRFEGEHVVMEPVRASTASLYGSLKSDRKPPTAAQLKKARVTQAARKYAR